MTRPIISPRRRGEVGDAQRLRVRGRLPAPAQFVRSRTGPSPRPSPRKRGEGAVSACRRHGSGLSRFLVDRFGQPGIGKSRQRSRLREPHPPGGQTPPGWSGTAHCSSFAYMGSWAAGFIVGTQTLSQTIATTAGDTYEFSFWRENQAIPPASFTASFGSDVVLSLSNVNLFGYTFEDFTVTAAAASTMISFAGSGDFWALDDVSVTAPEPATLSLFGRSSRPFPSHAPRVPAPEYPDPDDVERVTVDERFEKLF